MTRRKRNKTAEILPPTDQEVLVYFETTKEFALVTLERDTDWPYEDGEGFEFNWFSYDGEMLNIPSHWQELTPPAT